MSDFKVCYRKLKNYKYQLMRNFEIQIDIKPSKRIELDFIILKTTGRLIIKRYYSWDGPSGPTFDTSTFMRGSLVHDALYQLMREKYLEQVHRRYADQLLKEICLEDGMSAFRAWYVHRMVRKFGGGSAKPVSKSKEELICIP